MTEQQYTFLKSLRESRDFSGDAKLAAIIDAQLNAKSLDLVSMNNARVSIHRALQMPKISCGLAHARRPR